MLAFAIFYSVMGLPLGWVADRRSRRAPITGGVLVWCFATAASGLAGGAVIHFAAAADAPTLPLVGAVWPWQATFRVVVGIAGLLLLPLLATIPEAARRTTALERATPRQGRGDFLREHRAVYVRHYVGIGI